MHKLSLVKIFKYLLRLSSGNENTNRRTADGRIDIHTDSQREIIIPRRYRVAGYKKKEGKKKERGKINIAALWQIQLIM